MADLKSNMSYGQSKIVSGDPYFLFCFTKSGIPPTIAELLKTTDTFIQTMTKTHTTYVLRVYQIDI